MESDPVLEGACGKLITMHVEMAGDAGWLGWLCGRLVV
jgi:hypothetical protein